MDVDPRLLQYIKEEQAKGNTEDTVRNELARVGWDKDSVDRAFAAAYESSTSSTAFRQHDSFNEKSSSGFLRRLITVVIILVLLGGIAAGAMYFEVPAKLYTLFISPQDNFLKSVAEMQELSSVSFDGAITVTIHEAISPRAKSRDARRIADIKQLQLALELYFDENGNYAPRLSALQAGGHIGIIPMDPLTDEPYKYSIAPDGSNYHLGATLEVPTNSALEVDEDASSKKAGWPDGFDGHDNASCGFGQTGACYDVSNFPITSLKDSAYQMAGLLFDTVKAQSMNLNSDMTEDIMHTIYVDGAFETSGQDYRAAFDVKANLAELFGEASEDFFDSDFIELDMSFQYTPEAYFFRINFFEAFALLLGEPGLAEWNNKWIRINLQEFGDFIGEPGLYPADNRWSKEISADATDIFIERVRSGKIFSVEKFADDVINDVEVDHYGIVVQREEFLDYINEVIALLRAQGEDLGDLLADSLNEDLKEIDEDISISGEVWVGKKDLYIHRMLMRFDVEGGVEGHAKVILDFTLSNHNQLIQFESTNDAIDIDELFNTFQL